jgi:zinc transport system substrate-binding protein
MRVLAIMLFLALIMPQVADAKLKVTASFWIIKHFAGQVAGDRADVLSIAASSIAPHDFKPSPRDIKAIFDSDVFLYQGAGLDPWAERIRGEVVKEGVIAVEFTEAMKDNLLSDAPERHALNMINRTSRIDSETKSTRVTDPHFWLDPVHAATMVTLINTALTKADPEGEAVYKENMFSYLRELRALDKDFRQGLIPCKLRLAVASHNAYSYLGSRYGFEVLALKGVSSHDEPSPRHMADLIKTIRENRIEYIFVEPFKGRRSIDSIVRETGVEVLVLDPIGSVSKEALASGRTYISAMRENLRVLKKAMYCGD